MGSMNIVMLRLIITMFLANSTTAFGFTGDDFVPPSPIERVDQSQNHFLQDQQGFGLTSDGLLGTYGVTPQQIVDTYAPHLSDLAIDLLRVDTGADMNTVHERYQLRLGKYRLFDAYISMHTSSGQLVAFHYELPDAMVPDTTPTSDDFISVLTLGFGDVPAGGVQHERRGLAVSGSFLVPAWRIERVIDGRTRIIHLDAQTGAILSDEWVHFALADVYARGPQDGATTTVQLPGLLGTGFLDGEQVQVYAPSAADPRAQGDGGAFRFDPELDALEFDQVMAYYAATNAINFFGDRFGFSMNGIGLTVSINTLAAGKPDNAQYVPLPEGPKILVGYGTSTMRNLARDTDVIYHEFGHHVIYQHLQTVAGESGMLHEGIADYFAYAINGDPYLGESLVAGKPYLRTGALGPEVRFDDPDGKRDRYSIGQILTTALWDIRGGIGEEADRIVFEALPYLPRTAGLRDFFLALFNAERDLFPAEDGSNLYGRNKCHILHTLVGRGFASHIGDIDGYDCGLDMELESVRSSDRLAGVADKEQFDGPSFGFTLGGRTCSTVGAGSPMTVWWIYFLPPFVLWWRRRS